MPAIAVKQLTTDLKQEFLNGVEEREQKIAAIKDLVGKDYDNLSQPVPVFQMVDPAPADNASA